LLNIIDIVEASNVITVLCVDDINLHTSKKL